MDPEELDTAPWESNRKKRYPNCSNALLKYMLTKAEKAQDEGTAARIRTELSLRALHGERDPKEHRWE